MSEIASMQLTAITTAVLAAGAIASAIFAVLAFRKQSLEVSILREQNKREAEYRRREQAVRILIWTGGTEESGAAHVRNTSDQPIRDLLFRWADSNGQTVGPAYVEGPLLPGRELVFEGIDTSEAVHATIDFRDINGIVWVAISDGSVQEMQYV